MNLHKIESQPLVHPDGRVVDRLNMKGGNVASWILKWKFEKGFGDATSSMAWSNTKGQNVELTPRVGFRKDDATDGSVSLDIINDQGRTPTVDDVVVEGFRVTERKDVVD